MHTVRKWKAEAINEDTGAMPLSLREDWDVFITRTGRVYSQIFKIHKFSVSNLNSTVELYICRLWNVVETSVLGISVNEI